MLLRFDGFELDTASLELSREGDFLPLAPQPTKVLAYLAENAGRTVSREEIQRHVWGDEHVEADLGLNSCIRKIRAQLGDDAGEPRFIRTLPRRGYRFVAELDGDTGDRVRRPGGVPWRWVAVAAAAATLGWFLLADERPNPTQGIAVGAAVPTPVALAVLPFENLSEDPAEVYISAGLTDETIARLGQIEPDLLAVIARTTAVQIERTDRYIPDIAEELKVDYVLEGGIRRENGRLRATVRLIDGRIGVVTQSEIFEAPTKDMLTAQASLADNIAGWLVDFFHRGFESLAAPDFAIEGDQYETYLQGLHYLHEGTGEGYRSARERFAAIVEESPEFAAGWSGLAEAELWLRWFGGKDPDESVVAARAAAERAIELAPRLGAPHLLLAYAALYADFDFEEAGRRFARALELEPGAARTQSWYAGYLSAIGAHDEALERARLARRLDPLAMAVRADLCWLHNYARRFEEALAACENALELQPGDAWTTLGRVEALRQLGRQAEAVDALGQLASAAPAGIAAVGVETWSELAASEPAAALNKALDWLETIAGGRPQPYFTASIAALRGHEGVALEMLDQAFRERDSLLVFVGVDPRFDSVRSSPRFGDLVTRLGLPNAPAKAEQGT